MVSCMYAVELTTTGNPNPWLGFEVCSLWVVYGYNTVYLRWRQFSWLILPAVRVALSHSTVCVVRRSSCRHRLPVCLYSSRVANGCCSLEGGRRGWRRHAALATQTRWLGSTSRLALGEGDRGFVVVVLEEVQGGQQPLVVGRNREVRVSSRPAPSTAVRRRTGLELGLQLGPGGGQTPHLFFQLLFFLSQLDQLLLSSLSRLFSIAGLATVV